MCQSAIDAFMFCSICITLEIDFESQRPNPHPTSPAHYVCGWCNFTVLNFGIITFVIVVVVDAKIAAMSGVWVYVRNVRTFSDVTDQHFWNIIVCVPIEMCFCVISCCSTVTTIAPTHHYHHYYSMHWFLRLCRLSLSLRMWVCAQNVKFSLHLHRFSAIIIGCCVPNTIQLDERMYKFSWYFGISCFKRGSNIQVHWTVKFNSLPKTLYHLPPPHPPACIAPFPYLSSGLSFNISDWFECCSKCTKGIYEWFSEIDSCVTMCVCVCLLESS